MENRTIIIDNGTGYSKIGYAINEEPDFYIPTVMSRLDKPGASVSRPNPPDLDFFVGKDAYGLHQTYSFTRPMKEGIINSWDDMERFW